MDGHPSLAVARLTQPRAHQRLAHVRSGAPRPPGTVPEDAVGDSPRDAHRGLAGRRLGGPGQPAVAKAHRWPSPRQARRCWSITAAARKRLQRRRRDRQAIDGVGLPFMSEEHAVPHLASGALVRVLEDWFPPFPGFFLYYPRQRQLPAALAALIETLRL